MKHIALSICEVYSIALAPPCSLTSVSPAYLVCLSPPDPLTLHTACCTVLCNGGHQKGPQLNFPEVVVYREEAAVPTHLVVYALHE